MDFQDEPKREFKGIFIPAEIWLDKSLSANEKMLYAEINSFTSNDLSCFISNQYIAEFLCVTETNASKILNSLIDKGLVEVTKFDGRKRYVIARQPCQICKSESSNLQDINITIEHKEKENILKESEIVDFWNENTKDYPKVAKVSTRVKRAIHARIKEGYTVEQIKQAILLMNSLGDFYKGKNENHWKADFLWIMQNTKGNFEKLLGGNLHTTPLQQQFYQSIIGGNYKTEPMQEVKLGIGEFLRPDGTRTYGSGTVTIPNNAPPRRYSNQVWINGCWTVI